MKRVTERQKGMPRLNAVVNHEVYQTYYKRICECETDRVFCCHQMNHLLDVARIAYIKNLEEGLGFDKELIYVAAVLHDIGKSFQYRQQIPHEIAGERIARRILDSLPTGFTFTDEEKALICLAVRGHRRRHEHMKPIEELFYESDKRSRMCLSCMAEKKCNWNEEDNNMIIGGKNFDTANHTYIMGILNVTPDSFSDGGKFNGMDAAIAHAHQMVEEGVDIIDVGGESTRPGHIQITDEEEIARVTPIIEVLKKEFDVPVSIDTYKSHVAEAALQAGADLVNDIWGLKYDKKMASVIAKYQAACCLMHNREKAEYQDFLKDFIDDMKECVRLAKAAGIEDDKIILDPGVGFGKTYEMNLEIIDKMEILNELGYPVLLGTSRKSVIGLTLDLPVTQREEGTMVTTVYGVQKGCAFVRVHDVEKNKRAIQMTKAIMRGHEV